MHLFRLRMPYLTMDEAEVLSPGSRGTIIDMATTGTSMAAAAAESNDDNAIAAVVVPTSGPAPQVTRREEGAPGGKLTTTTELPRLEHRDAQGRAAVRMGVAICFDIRFPQLAQHYALHGTSMLCIPAAFNMVTGPRHWHLLARMRAVDNQQFVFLCSPARDTGAEYVAYGHSLIVSPMGEILAEAKEGDEGIVCADVDLAVLPTVRQQLPSLAGMRFDVYSGTWHDGDM
jgi:hypothetical protein